MKGYELIENTIVINKDLSDLDVFLKDFLEVLKKHSDYLVVSGFVSISTGRTRGTEDIDILIPILLKNSFLSLFEDLINNNFWCYQSDEGENTYDYVKNKQSIRFARINEMFPNIELVPFDESKKAKYFEFNHPQKIKIDGFEFKIPPIEFEILYKEIVLAGKKDIEDALHLRTFFKDILDKNKFNEYMPIINGELR